MTTETFIAAYDESSVELEIVAESNSINYRFDIGGSTNHSIETAFLNRNDVDITQTVANGLNIREFNNPNDIGTIKSFELTNVDSSVNTAFETYITGSTSKLIAIFSGKFLKSSDNIDILFSKWGSLNWPGKFLCDKYSCGYVAFYSPELKRIVSEVMISSDGTETDLARLTVVYDDLYDIGVLGFPNTAIKDSTEYSTTTEYIYKRYPDESFGSMADYGILPNTLAYISADLYVSEDMVLNNMETRLYVRWMNDSTILTNELISTGSTVGWHSIDAYIQPPPTANNFSIVVYRYPSTTTVALSAIKNLVFTSSSKNAESINKTNVGAMGPNGIRSSKFSEVTDVDLMVLKTTSTSNRVLTLHIQESYSIFPYMLVETWNNRVTAASKFKRKL